MGANSETDHSGWFYYYWGRAGEGDSSCQLLRKAEFEDATLSIMESSKEVGGEK